MSNIYEARTQEQVTYNPIVPTSKAFTLTLPRHIIKTWFHLFLTTKYVIFLHCISLHESVTRVLVFTEVKFLLCRLI